MPIRTRGGHKSGTHSHHISYLSVLSSSLRCRQQFGQAEGRQRLETQYLKWITSLTPSSRTCSTGRTITLLAAVATLACCFLTMPLFFDQLTHQTMIFLLPYTFYVGFAALMATLGFLGALWVSLVSLLVHPFSISKVLSGTQDIVETSTHLHRRERPHTSTPSHTTFSSTRSAPSRGPSS